MATLEGEQIKKQNAGFAFLLLGVIFALAPMPFFWWIGVTLGISGLVVVFRYKVNYRSLLISKRQTSIQ